MKTFSREIYDKANRVKMTDYLKIYEKFKDVKEVKDYIDDISSSATITQHSSILKCRIIFAS